MSKSIVHENNQVVNPFAQTFVGGELNLAVAIKAPTIEYAQQKLNNNTVFLKNVNVPLTNGDTVELTVETFDLNWEHHYEDNNTVYGTLKVNILMPITANEEDALLAANYMVSDLNMDINQLTLALSEKPIGFDQIVNVDVCDFSLDWERIIVA